MSGRHIIIVRTMNEAQFKLLETGTNSQIFLYGGNVVLKMVDVASLKQARHLRNEYELMRNLSHPNILRCHNFKQNIPIGGTESKCSGRRRHILLLDYAEGGSLLGYIQMKNPTMQARLSIVEQLVNALHFLHVQQRIAHRDLKLDNVLIRFRNGKPYPLISDFGFAIQAVKDSTEPLAHSYKGTKKGYMAPELHNLLKEVKPYDPFKVDIFAMGTLIFAALFGKLPFEYASATDSHYSLLTSANTQAFWHRHKISTESHPQIPMMEDLQQLLEGMLTLDSKERLSIQEVKKSEWIQGISTTVKQQTDA